MKCLENVGMLSTKPINYEGKEIVPIQFLKALLPDPASLGPRTVGKTNIGCIFTGTKDGENTTIYIDNVGKGVFNVEEFDPDPYMDMLNKFGLPWVVDENPATVE